MKYDIESIKKRKHTYSIIKKIMYVFIIILIYNIILLSVSYFGDVKFNGFFGYRAYAITTNSMEKCINKGDAIIAKKCNKSELHENDIITFIQNGEYITHRIVSIREINNEVEYTTKGDNNVSEDEQKVKFEDIQGKEVIIVPFLGNFINLASNSIFIIIIILIIMIVYLYKMKLDEKKENRREKKKIEDENKQEK